LVAVLAFLLIGVGISVFALGTEPASDRGARFRLTVVDPDGPFDPWGKSVGDINGDGLPDLIVGGNSPRQLGLFQRVLRKLGIRDIEWPENSELVWYESPTWQKHVIADADLFRTDHEVVDIDQDGRNDVVVVTDGGLVWFRNPEWSRHVIDVRTLHDVEVGDLDGDGDIDLVARDQSGFGHDSGDQLHFYRQDSPSQWTHSAFNVPHGEGLRVADLDGDARLDVVVNQYWYKNPGVLSETQSWPERPYSPNWAWPDVFIDVADINADGYPDIVLSPAEPIGERYHISWFEAPVIDTAEWREHIVDSDVETVHHSIAARDLDNDGDVDLVTAKMPQGNDPDDISIYWNQAAGMRWERQVLGTTGSHSMRIVDVDNDGDFDVFGANWRGEYQAVELWENRTCSETPERWQRWVIDEQKPWRSVFIMAVDLDQDGYKDLVTGGWWYRNPGVPMGTGDWRRRSIGEPANNAALLLDFDTDGDQDILASTWRGERGLTLFQRILRKLRIRKFPPPPEEGGFVLARNDGAGAFDILRNVASGEGDFLQGVAAGSFGGNTEVVLSWHEVGNGVQMLRVPDDPIEEEWSWRRISTVSQDEAVSAGDLDGDGDLDLVLGTRWLRNEGGDQWTPLVLHPRDGKPDRNLLVDMNDDGRLDVVVGFEAVSVPGDLAWYEQTGDDPTEPWTEHLIANVTGPMSLDVADIDQDGDPDVIVGEHNLEKPETARLLILENVDGAALTWRERTIYTGDEHHDGAQVADIDNDGDEDIISIGWGHRRVVLYENQNFSGRCPNITQQTRGSSGPIG
jgi:hypothetical protein